MSRLCTIYALSDPRVESVFENIRYVGKTIKPISHRLMLHIVSKETTHKASWVKSLLADGVSPCIWPLAICCEDNWQDIERYWIARIRKIADLTNHSDGGRGPSNVKWNAEQRQRLSVAMKGKKKPPFTERQLQLMREAKLGKKHTPEHNAKMSKLMTGRVVTWANKIRDAKKGVPQPWLHTKEAAAKRAASRAGYRHSQETIEKIRQSNSTSVICIQTGQTFSSLDKCGAHNIARAIRTGWKAGGFNWKYALNT